MARAKTTRTPVESIKHRDKRTNIPTEELRDFVAEDEKTPKKILYPRDPSLDPQLVWKGKDEQDQRDLEVPAVPIYIQEKIHPQAIIEELRAEFKGDAPEQANLFGDFNGISFEQQIEFYQHKDGLNWANRMIVGDSLLVMNSLAEKEGLRGKVQMIYIDPPYGIKFGSNWQVSTRKRDVKDRAEDATRQPEQIRAFRDTWEHHIHSYLSYLRDRLTVARELLSESGSVFVQIGDANVHLVRCILDETFGAENFCSLITFAKTSALGSALLPGTHDYILWYAKNKEVVKYRTLFVRRKERTELGTFSWIELEDGSSRRLSHAEQSGEILAEGKRFRAADLTRMSWSEIGSYAVEFSGRKFTPPSTRRWATNPTGMDRLIRNNRVIQQGDSLAYKLYEHDFPWMSIDTVWDDTILGTFSEKWYVVQTSDLAIARCMLMTTDPGDLVLDPTCGSGTTAFVAEHWGRRWIVVDTSRVAIALARTRLMAAKYPYYLLADSPEGIKKEMEISGSVSDVRAETSGDIKHGFVYKRVPHITLKSIANNSDIKEGMSREEIDAAITRHAETELFYDQLSEDNKRVRVSGPFTVESLSPHRVLSTSEERPGSETEAQKDLSNGKFEMMILENLRKAGVQNTVRNERLKLDRLESFSGLWLQGAGEFTDKDGNARRVAVSIGPEYGTVGPDQVKEAAKEALKGAGFDLLLVCGFAFDAHAGETAKEFAPSSQPSEEFAIAAGSKAFGKLQVLLVRMNPDLAMGDELLKKTGAGNLFMVFGEPDVKEVDPATGKIIPRSDGRVVVTLRGVDVYDPTTGEIRSRSTDDIACWFIDTNYNGESFFVRHAYFTGADEPYDKLKRALRAEINEAAWSALYKTESRSFDPPKTGKIAIKVINHYGDEVLKVYEVEALL